MGGQKGDHRRKGARYSLPLTMNTSNYHQCRLCRLSYQSESALKRHFLEKHSATVSNLKSARISGPGPKKASCHWKCVKCHRKFKTLQGLVIHQRFSHPQPKPQKKKVTKVTMTNSEVTMSTLDKQPVLKLQRLNAIPVKTPWLPNRLNLVTEPELFKKLTGNLNQLKVKLKRLSSATLFKWRRIPPPSSTVPRFTQFLDYLGLSHLFPPVPPPACPPPPNPFPTQVTTPAPPGRPSGPPPIPPQDSRATNFFLTMGRYQPDTPPSSPPRSSSPPPSTPPNLLNPCAQCHLQFPSSSQLIQHVALVHSRQGQEYKCRLCHTLCLSKTILVQHFMPPQSCPKIMSMPPSSTQCCLCNLRFSTRALLQDHLASAHVSQMIC